jgi:beta-lactamase regulating signal transducer with metallopeptidase domain
MISLTNWISPGVMHSLGWALLHFLWQGTALAALAAILMTLFRRALARYAVAVAALALMLAAPLATFFWLMTSTSAIPRESTPVAETQPTATRHVAVTTSAGISRLTPSLDGVPLMVELWLLGVALFSLRSAGGVLLLEGKRRKLRTTVTDQLLAMCQTLQHQLGLNRTIRYRECSWLQAPAVIGWFRPIVLLPVTALTGLSEEQLRSVIAHELAHIQRFDPFVNVFQISVETLLFYHPAVWWLNKRIRAEREHCCDDVAVSVCGNPVEYARALTLMEEWRSAPVLAMAANRGPLSERIFRVLGVKSGSAGTGGIGLTSGLLCLAAALVAGDALLGIAYPIAYPGSTVFARASFVGASTSSPQSSPEPASAPAHAAKSSTPRSQTVDPQPATGGSYIDDMRAAGLSDLTVDELIAMKIQGVTSEYVRGLREQGMHPGVNSVVAMRIQGVTPEYIHDLHSLSLNPDEDQVVAMKIQGVDANYVRGIRDAGIHSNIDQLIALKIQGATLDYVRGLHESGLQLSADELVGMRVQGVMPEYVREIYSLGVKPTADEFISMRVQNVTADYIRALQSAGLKFDVDGVIAAKVQGVTPEFIERAIKRGFQNLTLDKLIQLKQKGILESPTEI